MAKRAYAHLHDVECHSAHMCSTRLNEKQVREAPFGEMLMELVKQGDKRKSPYERRDANLVFVV